MLRFGRTHARRVEPQRWERHLDTEQRHTAGSTVIERQPHEPTMQPPHPFMPSPTCKRLRHQSMRSVAAVLPVILLLLLSLLSRPLLVSSASASYSHGHLTRDATIRLRLGATGSSDLWLAAAAQAYMMRRADVDVTVVSSQATPTTPSARVALGLLERAVTDAAFLPMTPTPAERKQAPDLMYLPFWATAFAPIYNLPTAEVGNDLVLSLPVLAKIFMGNITK
jgi:ABC-type phosphate transport system substrate-binding protein